MLKVDQTLLIENLKKNIKSSYGVLIAISILEILMIVYGLITFNMSDFKRACKNTKVRIVPNVAYDDRLPHAQNARDCLREQNGPRRPRPLRPARRAGGRTPNQGAPALLAHQPGAALQGCV